VIRAEDESSPAAVLTGALTVEASPAGRHLSYWTYEAKGLRQLHVFDTITLGPAKVIFETEDFGKIPVKWSADEQFVAIPLVSRPGTERLVHVNTGGWLDTTSATIASLPVWGGAAARPQADPGTSMPVVVSRFTRLDGSATTYLTFDSSAGGRWYGERVEVATGKRTPIEWSTGGNPQDVIWVGYTSARHVHSAAPPRGSDGEITAAGALWAARQNVGAPVTREAVRSMRYGEYFDWNGGGGLQPPRGLTVHIVVFQTEAQPKRGLLGGQMNCRSTISMIRADGRSEGTFWGCTAELWPSRLPPAFAIADQTDWTSPKGPTTPAPSPSIVR
jgi:hypothetical protein